MSLNRELKKAQEENIFTANDNRAQMEEAFKGVSEKEKKTPVKIPDISNFKAKSERKISVTYTLPPKMEKQMQSLAKKHGYSSTSAFVRDVFQAIIDQEA